MKFFLLDQKLYKISAVKVKEVLSSHGANRPIFKKNKVKEAPTFPMKAQKYWPDLIGIDGNCICEIQDVLLWFSRHLFPPWFH